MDNKAEISNILEKLVEADTLYHTFGNSDISDAVYDALKDRLRVLDPTNKIFKAVGSAVPASTSKEHWEKISHGEFKMGSQNKVTNKKALEKWIGSLISESYIVEHKLDGISIKMIYNLGKLVSAATRGEGDVGEDITRNVKRMNGVPKIINKTSRIVIRGEIILRHSNLSKIGGKNARNSAAGTAKRLDGVGCEYLDVIVYDIMNTSELGITSETDTIKLLTDLGFNVVKNYKAASAEDIDSLMFQYETNKRKALDWDIDGLVIKTNDIKPDSWEYPNRSVAYKFKSIVATTKLLDVVWQDSGGRINPVAILEPVDICGTTVSKATLNNIDHIRELGIQIGDTVLVSRRNDVIPCVEGVSIKAKDGKAILPPEVDADGFKIVHAKNSLGEELVYLVSTNPNSRSKKVRQIITWYIAHGAKGVAEETIGLILEAGIATDLPSFFKVGLSGDVNLTSLDGFGAGKFKILNKATKLTEHTDIIKFLTGMDLPGFSEKRFETILNHFNKEMSIKNFLDILINNNKEVSEIAGFGDNTALSLKQSLIERQETIVAMLEAVTVDDWHPSAVQTQTRINGLSFCFTGKMTNERGVYEKMVKAKGGLVAGVSKTLDYLVTNDPNSGSSKNEKADKLGIKKITEKEFLELSK